MRFIILSLILLSCGGTVQHCPINTAQVALDCKAEVKAGTKTKEQCYQLIEDSCP